MFDLDELEETEADLGRWAPWEPLSEEAFAKHPRSGGHPEAPRTMSDFKKVLDTSLPGEFWGIEFPHSPGMLKEMGPAWLTKAMHTFGSMPQDNEVTEFLSMDVKGDDVNKAQSPEDNNWGGACLKVLLKVRYRSPSEDLPEDFFIKVPHPFTGKNERFKISVTQGGEWNEIMFYNTLAGRLPIKTPRCYFADINRKTTNFCLVIERIKYCSDKQKDRAAYKPGEVFPAPGKYRDWAIPGITDYYYAHARCLAQLFAWHKRVGDVWGEQASEQVRSFFLDDGSWMWRKHCLQEIGNIKGGAERDLQFRRWTEDPGMQGLVMSMGFTPQVADGFLEMLIDFVATAKHMLPADLVEGAFMEKFTREAKEMSKYVAEMNFYPMIFPEYHTLAHPNAQIDNGFYWADETGTVQAGLIDLGMGFMPSPVCLANAWIGAEPDMMDEHEEKLTRCFLDEYEKAGGFKLDYEALYLNVKLAHAAVLYGCSANIGTLLTVIPKKDWKDIKDRRDPQIDNLFLARCYMVQIEMFLAMWRQRSPYRHFQKWLRKTGIKRK